jgi:hypothetical protein
MPFKQVSEDEYIDVLNAELHKEGEFEEGMRFIAYPPGATSANITGYAWEGPLLKTGVFARAAVRASEQVSIRPRKA